jgi:methyl-accepting chemotaxis protein
MISQIQQDARRTVYAIESGMKEIIEGKIVINKALQALDDIAKKVHAVDDTIKEVSELLHNQVRVVEQISKRAGDIASVAEENAGATEESAAATEQVAASIQETSNAIHDLKNLGSSLQDLLSKFTIAKDSVIEHRSPPGVTGSERQVNANDYSVAKASDFPSNSVARQKSSTDQSKGAG